MGHNETARSLECFPNFGTGTVQENERRLFCITFCEYRYTNVLSSALLISILLLTHIVTYCYLYILNDLKERNFDLFFFKCVPKMCNDQLKSV